MQVSYIYRYNRKWIPNNTTGCSFEIICTDNPCYDRWVHTGTYLEFVHTGKSFRNLIKSTRNQIVLIWIQTDVRSDPNQSENGKYNQISGWFNKISKRFPCVYVYTHTRRYIRSELHQFTSMADTSWTCTFWEKAQS